MGDRSGGREAKGSSLKKSKSNPGSTAALKQKAKSTVLVRAALVIPIETIKCIDNAVAIASRLFEHDRDRMLKRAQDEGVAVVAWCNDMEKLTTIADIAKENTGLVYFAAGVHPDNVDRANKKANELWLEKVTECSCRAECIAVLSGLNLSRDTGTHFAQETLLKSSAGIAVRFDLPLVLHVTASSVDRAVELLRGEDWLLDVASTRRVLVHDITTAAAGDVSKVRLLVEAGCYCSVSPAGLQDADERTLACLRAIPMDRLVLCSDSPWHTPQNIDDPYLRTLRNEPSNLLFVMKSVATIIGVAEEVLQSTLARNSNTLYGLLRTSSEGTATAGPTTSSSSIEKTTEPKQKKSESVLVKALTTYCCRKCRSELFAQSSIVTHDDISSRTVFKAGQQEGTCAANIFVSCGEEGKAPIGLSTNRDVVECIECGAKVGRYFSGDGVCSCGVTVAGPIHRVNTAKIDIKYNVDTDEQLNELATLAKSEAEMSRLKLDYALEHSGEGETDKKSKKKGKVVKERGAGNFSSYRNKSFIPNASRRQKVQSADDAEAAAAEDVVEGEELDEDDED